jgi:DNA polymerase III delta prime subunit
MAFFEDTEQNKSNNSLWVEKYRPRRLSEYVGNEHLKEKVGQYIETGDVPHLLLFGKAGTGKTTLAKLIVNSIECDHIIINASDENNVETVRTKVKNFASTVGFKERKIIILDEFDYMTPNAQAILRNLMETFSKHTRFILTCNYVEKVIDPIQSRTQTFQVVPPTKKDVAVQISKILQKEEIKFQPQDLVPIIDSAYPDIRKIINTCQLNSSKGVLKVDTQSIVGSDIKSKILDILKTKDVSRNKYVHIRQTVADFKIQDFTEIYTFLYDKVDDYTDDPTGVILKLADGSYKDSLVVDKEITFMATILEVLRLTCKS